MGSTKWTALLFGCCSVLIFVLEIRGCWSLNPEGLALLKFRARVDFDPYEALSNWNAKEKDPCMWSGVHCVHGKVQVLDLDGLYLEGTLAPELGKLVHLTTLILSKNRFYGNIPSEIGRLTLLELLDLRDNNLGGIIPVEIGAMQSLKRLLISDNKFEGFLPIELGNLKSLVEFQSDENLTFSADIGLVCVNRKFGHCSSWQSSLRQLNKADAFLPVRWALKHYLNAMSMYGTANLRSPMGGADLHASGDDCCRYHPSSYEHYSFQSVQHEANFIRRRLLEQWSNLEALPAPNGSFFEQNFSMITQSSGSFPAVPNATNNPSEHTPGGSDGLFSSKIWKYVLITSGVLAFVIVMVIIFCLCPRRGAKAKVPWKAGLSGQLQKAFVTGVPKLKRSELVSACEDFSNIIDSHDGCVIYKGTLSSGVEIAVSSTTVPSVKEWSRSSQYIYLKKIEALSRINHKNFINLIGYCEEDAPFVRMMVFEYASNGSLYEHLHVKEMEHLDWNARIRIIMGTAYCLQHFHHDINPPIAHPNLHSSTIYLTDDYSTKIADVGFWKEVKSKANSSGENESKHSESPVVPAEFEANVYSFGMLLLEIISGKIPFSEEHGSVVNWAAKYLRDKRSIGYMVDPTLKSFKNNELEIICDVIQDCVQSDPKQRPTMKEAVSKLRQVITVTPDAATPRLSPLWWAELEILSTEAS